MLNTENHRQMEMEVVEREVSLLDLLAVVAENLKLLILGTVVVGLLALGIGYALPQSFTSRAILAWPTSTPTQAAAIIVSPLVLNPVIESLNLSGGRPIQVARTELAKQIKAAAGKDGLLRLDVTANTPLEAQALAKQLPTLPTEPAAPKKSLIAVLAALGSGFVLLLWMFMRQAGRMRRKTPRRPKNRPDRVQPWGSRGGRITLIRTQRRRYLQPCRLSLLRGLFAEQVHSIFKTNS